MNIKKYFNVVYMGGLGNQLFQYATVRALMKENDNFFFDLDTYKADYLNRNFNLYKFNIKGQVIKNFFIRKAFKKNTRVNILLKKIGLFSEINEDNFYVHYSIYEKAKLFTTIKGYWQSPFYFDKIRNTLLKELTPLNLPIYPRYINDNTTVAIHIRRTDYLNDSRYGFIGLNYYQNAVRLFKQKLINPLFILFSDDIAWAKQHFNTEEFVYCEEKEWGFDYLQLHLISKCTHQIIANSSFSWWGAWLNQNENKMVVRPLKPFNDESLYYEKHYPAEWIAV